MNYEDVCRAFGKDSYGKNTIKVCCPCHDDKTESLSISRGKDGRTLINCFAGCNVKDIVLAVGLTMQDLYQDNGRQGGGRTADRRKTVKDFANYKGNLFQERYDYYNRDGYAFTKIRVKRSTGGKSFFTVVADDSGEYVEKIKLPKSQADYCALYPKKALFYVENPKEIVYIVEGEKDVRNAMEDGLQAVTVGAAANWTKGHADYFNGLSVVIVPDNDVPGMKCALREAVDLKNTAADVHVIKWPAGFQDKGDYSDFVAGFRDRSEGIKAFLDLAKNAADVEDFKKTAADIISEDKIKKTVAKSSKNSKIQGLGVSSELIEKLTEIKPEEHYLPDDKGYARIFSDLFPECRASLNSKGRDWYFYDGKRWNIDTGGFITRERCKSMAEALYIYAANKQAAAYEECRDAKNQSVQQAANYLKDVQTLGQFKKRQNIINDAVSINPIGRESLDAERKYFNCQNGIYDLSRDCLIDHDPELMLSKISNVIYDPFAKSERFEKFINEIMQGNTEKASFMQRALGYSLLGNPKEETCFILYGATTRNGKSTLCETILYLFGGYGINAAAETMARKNNKDSRTASGDIARLSGSRFVNVPELNRKMILDEAQLKTLTGRDSITARNLYETEFEFKPQFVIFMNTNSLPVVNDMTLFSSNRINVITFDRHFEPEEQDRDLKEELQKPESISAIFNWLLAGLRSYRQQGLNPPECVKMATDEYKSDSDKIGRFVQDELVRKPGHNEKALDIYRIYEEWCNDSGYGVENKGNFFSMLKERGMFASSGTVRGFTYRNVVKGYATKEKDFEPATDTGIPFKNQ